MRKVGALKRLAVALVATTALLAIAAVSGAAPGTDASVTTFDQCANGGPPSTSTACPENWINGILNANNSHYAEDEVTPQRVILELPKDSPTTGRTVEISYLTRKGGVHAYDSLATWNHTQTTADRCANLNAADCVPDPASTLPVPSDPTVVADNDGGGSATSGHQLGGQVFTMYGGELTGASSYTHDDASGSSDSYAHITLTYSVPSTDDGAKVMLLFGGHIAAGLGSRGWGPSVGAGSISGGPYHIRITAADGASVGNRDNQIMSGAILSPANIVIRKNTVGGDATFGYTATGGIASNFDLATSGGTASQSFTNITAGSYTVTESTLPAGWDFTNLVCVDEDSGSTVDLAARKANIDLDPGETVTCTFTNTKRGNIIIEKQTQPDGSAQLFTFARSYGGNVQLSDGQQDDSGLLAPGSYSVSETVPSGWSLTSSSCDDGSSPSAISLAAGETVKCTFNNAKDATVIVKKVMVGGTGTFSYTGTPSGSIAVNNGTITQNVAPGAYSSVEGAATGWDLTSIACDDSNSTGSVSTRTASFNVEAGETVTCTFTNTKLGKVIVKKLMVGDTDTFSYTGTPAGDISVNEGTISADVAPGQYLSTEAAKAGWDLTAIACDDANSTVSLANRRATFNVAAGETVTCTFTNEKDANIVVQKQTDPDGSTQLFTFTRSYGSNVQLADGQSNDSGDLDPGTYSVSEVVPAGWDLQSAVCSDQSAPSAIGLAAGETVTCVFTNKLRRGEIIVSKQTNPDNDPQSFAFSASYDAGGFSLSDGQSNESGDLLPGTYSVSETVPAGWDLDSATCDDGSAPGSISLAAGETVRCVFTNEKDASIVVQKQTNPDNDPQSFAFSASYDSDGFSLSDGQSNNSGDLDPGTYSVSETVPQGWDLESAVCSDGSSASSIGLDAGETVTCVFTNEKDARIVVQKVTNPSPDAQQFAFSANYDGDGFSLAGGQSNDSGDLDPGTYSVSENVPAGWDLTSAVCSDESAASSIALAAGETVTCVFTNTKRGTIIVEKQTAPDNASGSFSFSGAAAGSIGDGGQIVVSNLAPGTYTSTEADAQGWSLTALSCDDANSTGSLGSRTATFRLEAGEIVKCTFANAKLGQGSIDVSKSVSPTSVKEPGGPVTYSVTITNTSADVMVTIDNVVDDKFGDLDDSGGNGCFDVPINLAPGGKVNCTFQKTITGPGGTSHLNVVTATGTDEAGNPVSDSDDARVDITPRLIDLVIVKEATSPTPLNGIVKYSLTVTNKGPDTATNVQLADPAPAGITYLTANPSQGTCNLSPALITCSLGSIAPGQTVTIAITGRATSVGSHTNTATVTGGGGRETNPADNVDSAVTVVPAPLKPPTAKPQPKPQPEPEVCLTLTVSPKMIKADGRPDKVTALVTAGKKRVKGVKVGVSGAGVSKAARTNRKGVAVLRINPRKPGIITVTVVETNQNLCGPKRIGVVGVFLPPLTG